VAKRQVGNFPQAFSHVSLVNAAYNLSGHPDVGEATPSRAPPPVGPPPSAAWRGGGSTPRNPRPGPSSEDRNEKPKPMKPRPI
jgi:hypothetical protein